ncbi:MAG: flagellar hook protein FlgE [Heliobacteriaceae bacterium]|nr:flagellar hook protein FlgE [Heliobacteriaceae bacterium]
MMRSLFSGITALRNHQARMDVIGNNIANINTVGFKKSRVTFQDILNQTVRGASSPQGGRGGTNPMQMGLGMDVATMETIHTASSPQGTGKNSDLAISGDGFFVVNDAGALYYTRAGNFDLDTEYNFVRTDNGMNVVGFKADSDGVITPTDDPAPLNLRDKLQMKAKTTNRVAFNKNLDGRLVEDATIQKPITIYDSKGGSHEMLVKFTKTANANEWKVETTIPGTDTGKNEGTLTFDTAGLFKSFNVTTAEDFKFPPELGVEDIKAMPAGDYDATAYAALTDANPELYLNLSGLSQFSSETTVSPLSQNGYADGALKTYAIDATGTLTGSFTNGQSQKLAQVVVTVFSNPAGLIKAGENLYIRSNNSGEPDTGQPGVGSRGTVIPGALEMSNVELAQEFTDMITTQRGFQANGRIITVSDSMLEELVNLKR